VWELNPQLKHTQFADFHGHGWVFRAVFKKDRQGNFLDHNGKILSEVTTQHLMAAVKTPELIREENRALRFSNQSPAKSDAALNGKRTPVNRDGIPVHLMDIHLEKGMHCIDCHFVQDAHGNGKLYQEVRAAIEIQCIDCHGTITKYATLRT